VVALGGNVGVAAAVGVEESGEGTVEGGDVGWNGGVLVGGAGELVVRGLVLRAVGYS